MQSVIGKAPEGSVRPRFLRSASAALSIAMVAALAACGGGGGGEATQASASVAASVLGDISVLPGLLMVKVADTQGTPVAGVSVSATANGLPTVSGLTDAKGLAMISVPWTSTQATVTVSGESVETQTVQAQWTASKVNDLAFTLTRTTRPAGGVLASRSGEKPTIADNGQSLSFEIEVVVVGGDGKTIDGLSAASFGLQACTPNSATATSDCVRGTGSDAAYGAATPVSVTPVAGQPERPYATTLLMDQSGSIVSSDPTGARLYSAKTFFGALGSQDQATLAAFASGTGTLIPTRPLTTYPTVVTSANATSLNPTLDALLAQAGGQTPLYASIDAVRQQLASDAGIPADKARSVIVFTDGADTTCRSVAECAAMRQTSIDGAVAGKVRLFTIGLSKDIDVEALSSLAVQTGGAMLYAETADQLIPLYGSLGRLVSLSLNTYRLKYTVQSPTAGAFASGRVLLGKVNVNANGQAVAVPFVVAVP